MSNKRALEITTKDVESAIAAVNSGINELGTHTYCLSTVLKTIQKQFDQIRGIPSDRQLNIQKLKAIRFNWKNEVDKIVQDYNTALNSTVGNGAAGTALGIGVATLGPTAAMGVATTFGVASTGTAISALSGAAATNAALAWLGGGAIAAGGSGMAGGTFLLSLAGPVGWTIAGLVIVSSGILYLVSKSDKERLIRLFRLVAERDQKTYNLANTEIRERIRRIYEETGILVTAIAEIGTFGLDYDAMTEEQQYKLGTYFNLLEETTQLLVSPIMSLMPKVTKREVFIGLYNTDSDRKNMTRKEKLIMYLSGLLYNISLEQKDFNLLVRSLKKNKDFVKQMKLDNELKDDHLWQDVSNVINYCQQNTQLTPQQQNDLSTLCPCREAGKVEVVTCPYKNDIWLKAFMKWACLLSQTENASTLVIMQDWRGEKNASDYLLSAYGLTQIDHRYIDYGVYSTIDSIKQAIQEFQSKHQEPIYVLMEHYTGTDEAEHAKDAALIQQIAQETHLPITLVQYNNEVF